MPKTNHEELYEIQESILQLIENARNILQRKDVPSSVRARAEAYWLAGLEVQVSNGHDFLGGTMCSMQDTINELDGSAACPCCGDNETTELECRSCGAQF